MKRLLLVLLMGSALLDVRAAADPSGISGSVVKIYAASSERDYLSPWRRQAPSAFYGSGCIIDGRRILTSAHVAADAQFILVKRAGAAEKYAARVLNIAHECDLAILQVEDEAFFEGAAPLALGDLVAPRDGVTVYGFPEGGEELSVTAGIVSRVEQNTYAHSRARLLCAQIDAAINPGSSGGPVVRDGRLVGIAFQAREGENISYMVPSPVVGRFLRDVADGRYDGIPSLEVEVQPLENPDLRLRLGLDAPDQMFRGVAVSEIPFGSPAAGILETADVILALDGRQVAYDGTVEFRPGERTDFNFLIQEKDLNDPVDIDVLRRGKSLRVRVILNAALNSCRLVPYTQYDRDPTYLIVAGLVFEPLTYNILGQWPMKDMPPLPFIYYSELSKKTADRRQVVFLAQVLADTVNVGYQFLSGEIVVEANGLRLKDFADLARAVGENRGDFHEFVTEKGMRLVVSRRKAEERKAELLGNYRVGADRSADLR